MLLNRGQAGMTLSYFLDVVCADASLPHAVDLLLFENYMDNATCARCAPVRLGPLEIEQLHHVMAHKFHVGTHALPLVVLSYLWTTEPTDNNMSWAVGLARNRCVPGWQHRMAASLRERSVEDNLAPALAYYGWSALSLRNAMWAGLRDGMPARHNLSSACEYASAFLNDQIHPNGAGMRLMGDALIALLNASRAVYDADAHDPRPPTRPLTPGAWARRHSMCTDAQQFETTTNGSDAGWAFVAEEEVRDRDTNVTRRVPKPGLLATTAGAAVTVLLNTRFAKAPPDAAVTLHVHYLTSYERMGDAELSCVAGCACADTRLNGTVPEAFSVTTIAALNVTQAERCALRLVARASPRGAKFKLLRLVVETAADGS
jgi:hypothetical protein